MKFKRGLAVLLAALLIMPVLPVSAEEPAAVESEVRETESAETETEATESETTETETTESEAAETETTESETAETETTESESTETETTESETAETETTESESAESGTTESETAETETTGTAASESTEASETVSKSEVSYNTGNHVWSVVDQDTFLKEEAGDAFFEEDGSFTIHIPEENPFFPYEVQFTYEGEVTNQWFMTPDDSVEIGGHTFYVSAYFDGTAVTQMSLNVAGDTVIVYPEEKEFTNDGDGTEELSLLPLEEKNLWINLRAYTPAELTMISVSAIMGEKLADPDKVIWTYNGYDDYTISESGSRINLSYRTSSSNVICWEMIAGTPDQLDTENIRYTVNVQVTSSREWLVPMVYTQDSTGVRTALSISSNSYYYDSWTKRYDRGMYVNVQADEMGDQRQAYVSLGTNPSVFSDIKYASARAYEGQFSTVEEAMAGTDITDQLFCTDMTQANAGYLMGRNQWQWVTMVTFDENGMPTGCMPVELYFGTTSNYVNVSYSMYAMTEKGRDYVEYGYSSGSIDGCTYYTATLYAGYAANGIYYKQMRYYREGSLSNEDVTGAYIGLYDSIEEAVSIGAQDVKDTLFNDGYAADYSQGVFFTVFVGEDGTQDQETYHYLL